MKKTYKNRLVKALASELFEEGGVGYNATPHDPFKNLPEIFKEYQKEFLKKVI